MNFKTSIIRNCLIFEKKKKTIRIFAKYINIHLEFFRIIKIPGVTYHTQ